MRIACLLPVVLLAACSAGGDGTAAAAASGEAEAAVAEDNSVGCALAGAKTFGRTCTREIAREDLGEVWIIRHPDGGFRRFVLIEGGTRIATADGDKEVRAERVGGELEVRVESDRYRFPAAPEANASGA
ncbi:hypothetical protein [Novosphingobium sp. TH158]|uniref:hypothetical protein n=1 Tax=Novosphingobium sp. TH158 TaxID=2067455 RepID=UPI000C7BC0DB|nr:hypothetical protein C0V78_04540 [Novosphingobium sp. TH158]